MMKRFREWIPTRRQYVGITLVGLGISIIRHASAQDMSAITAALNAADTEVRSSVFPAVAGILAAIVLIAVAARAISVIVGRN